MAGRAALEEGAEALLPLGARAPGRCDLSRRLSLRALSHEAFRLPDGLRAALQDRRHKRVDGLIRLVCDLVDEADAERGDGVESLAREEVAPRGLPDPPEHEGRDDGRDDPEPDLREAEERVWRSHR